MPQNYGTSLCLRQIKGFNPPKAMNVGGVVWELKKDARDSSVDIPNPNSIQWIGGNIVPCDNTDKAVYLYYAYGLKQPRPNSYEQATNVMFLWFNDKQATKFDPSVITESDWNRANVYTAPCTDYGINIRDAYLSDETVTKGAIEVVERKPDMEVNFLKGKNSGNQTQGVNEHDNRTKNK